MVATDLVERKIGAYLENMRLPIDDTSAVVDELRRRQRGSIPLANPAEAKTLRRQLDIWQRLFVTEEIDERTYKREVASMQELEAPVPPSTSSGRAGPSA
jgi:hypothetical protein